MIEVHRGAVLVAAIALSACTTADLSGQPFFGTLEATRPGQATLYFYRVKPTIAANVPATITINGKTAGELLGGSYFVTRVPAGHYRITSSTSPLLASRDNSSFDLQVDDGKNYFVADQEDTTPFTDDSLTLGEATSGRYMRTMFYFRYALVPQDEALRALKWCQRSAMAR
jgi:hypothetical protein